MAIADTKTRITITIDRSLAEQVEDIAERESRPTSNVIQLLVEHGLRDRNKYRFGPLWCTNILGKRIVFEQGMRTGMQYFTDEDGEEDQCPTYTPYLAHGKILDVIEWRDSMRLVVEVDKLDEFGESTGEKDLVFLYPEDILSVVDDKNKTIFSRAPKAAMVTPSKPEAPLDAAPKNTGDKAKKSTRRAAKVKR